MRPGAVIALDLVHTPTYSAASSVARHFYHTVTSGILPFVVEYVLQ